MGAVGASLVNLGSPAASLDSLIFATGANAEADNWYYITSLYQVAATLPGGATIVYPSGPLPISRPLVPPINTIEIGTGQLPQSLDSGVPPSTFGGTQFVPTVTWAQQAGNTVIAAGSNGLTLPQATLNVAATGPVGGSPAFVNPGGGTAYVLVETIPVGGPGSYDGGWNLVAYTGLTATTLTGCTLPFGGNAGASQMFTGMPVVQATPITACTILPGNIASVTAANSYYPGQPVIVMANGFTGVYPPQGTFEVLSATPTGFTVQLLGTPLGSFSASGSATAPYDALRAACNPYCKAIGIGYNPGSTVNRASSVCAEDNHHTWCFFWNGIVTAIDTDPQSPVNSTRGRLVECYVEQGLASGVATAQAIIWFGNNILATDLYKTNGTIYAMGGGGKWEGHISGGTPGSVNVFLGNADTWVCNFDSVPPTALGMFAKGGRPSNPNVKFVGCNFYNSTGSMGSPVNKPIFHGPTTGAMGVTISGDCTVDSSIYGQWSMLDDNPAAQDQVLDGFATSSTSNLGLAGNPLFPASPGSSGLSYPGGYYGSVLCGGVIVRGSIMDKITANVSLAANTATAIITATVGVGIWQVSAQAAVNVTGGTIGTFETCEIYISSGALGGTAVFLMNQSVGVTALSAGVDVLQASSTPQVMLSLSGEISVTTAGTIVLVAVATAAGTVNHLSPVSGLGGLTSILFKPVGV
jgi:hypothetical protein